MDRRRVARVVTLALLVVGSFGLAPASPAGAVPPVIESFTAEVSDTNQVTLSWSVSGGDPSNLLYIYEDVGFRQQDCTPEEPGASCSTTVRVSRGGVHRYTLSVRNGFDRATQTVEATVDMLPKPEVPAHRVSVDMLDPQDQELSWSHPGTSHAGEEYVKLRAPGALHPLGTEFPLVDSHTVPVDKFGTWHLTYCVRPAADVTPLCSAGTEVTYVEEPAQFDGGHRRFADPGEAVDLSWSGSGDWWHVSSPTLGLEQWVAGTPELTIPAAQVVPGVHTVSLVSCVYPGPCTNRTNVVAEKAGTVEHLIDDNTLNWGLPVAELTPDDGSPVQQLDGGMGTYFHVAADGAHVAEGETVGYVIGGGAETLQLVVDDDASIPAFETRSLATDFDPSVFDTSIRPSTGMPLDITIDSAGDVWSVGEFGTAAAHIEDGELTHHESRYGRQRNPDTGLFERTKPFRSSFGSNPAKTVTSALVERVIDTGSAIWWAQAGANGSHADNHNRLIRFDRTGQDDPATPDDDRVCSVHLPGDDQKVVGLAHDPATDRIWYAQKSVGGQPPAISWFVDGDLSCNNDLRYQEWVEDENGEYTDEQNVGAIEAAAATNRCDPGETAGCIHRIDLPEVVNQPGHLVVDNDSGYLWIATLTGGKVSRFPLTGDDASDLETFPLADPVRGGWWFAGHPWQVRVDSEALYLNEYHDNQLLRVDKAMLDDPQVDCTQLVDGENPCISEVFLPMAGEQVNAHSIALRDGKLWFTMGAEARGNDAGTSGSYVGYVDTASWDAGTPQGVIYDDLASLGPPPDSDHWSVRGIEVDGGGRVALAESGDAVLLLDPTT